MIWVYVLLSVNILLTLFVIVQCWVLGVDVSHLEASVEQINAEADALDSSVLATKLERRG